MTINCKGKLLNLDSPIVMGILNVTPDSFYDGGTYTKESEVLQQVELMLNDGATIIDVGGHSSKPGATEVSIDDELERVIPTIKLLVKRFPEIIISIDTFRSKVARKAIEAGAAIINDISAGNFDDEMFSTVRELQVPYIIMHMQGTPQTMQNNPTYNNIIEEVMLFFSGKIAELNKLGVNDVIIDLGFGFGKTSEHNFELLNQLDFFTHLNKPILAGVSRKSMIYNTLNTTPDNALNGTTALNSFALQKGAQLLRVHDVKEATETIKLFNKLQQ